MRISDWSSDVCSSDLPSLAPLSHIGCQQYLGSLRSIDAASGCMQQGHRTIVVALSHTADIDNAHLRFVPDSYRHIDERQRLPFVSPAAARLLGYHFSDIHLPDRSEERRGGKECVSKCRSRWSPYH